jgi:hypothetical protein
MIEDDPPHPLKQRAELRASSIRKNLLSDSGFGHDAVTPTRDGSER